MMKNTDNKTRRMVMLAMLFATAVVLSIVEGMLPQPIPVPGVRFGLSNIVVMYAVFFLNAKDALMIAVLKAFFGMLTRGAVAGLLSLSGGVFSVCIMVILLWIFKEKGSYLLYSMCGALAHNIGQFAAISLLYTSMSMIYYLPVLLISGVVAGSVTSVLLKTVLPLLKHFCP